MYMYAYIYDTCHSAKKPRFKLAGSGHINIIFKLSQILVSASEGTLQELDKLYPSDSPNQLAEEAIFNPTKYSLLNLQNLKQ